MKRKFIMKYKNEKFKNKNIYTTKNWTGRKKQKSYLIRRTRIKGHKGYKEHKLWAQRRYNRRLFKRRTNWNEIKYKRIINHSNEGNRIGKKKVTN